MNFKIVRFLVISLTIALFGATQAHAGQVLKIGTLAPEGTSLHKGLVAVKNAIKEKTNGAVDVTIYAGGTAGDEKDMVRKGRIGQLHGFALTGVGMGMIEPEVRVLELPFLFSNQAQIDKTYAAMKPYFEKKFLEKGFVLLGWAEVGFVQIFSNKPITKKADLSGMKMWMWEGDPLAQAMYEAMKVVPVPLAITDVLTSLQTGLVDGAYAPPLGAIAFQWHTKAKYMTKVDLVNGTGGLLIAKKAWDSLGGANQAIVKNVIAEEAKKLTDRARLENSQSIEAIKAAGIQVVELTPEARTELETISKDVQSKLVGKLYPQSLLDKVLALAK